MKKRDFGRERIAYLIIIMTVVSFLVACIAGGILYFASFEQQKLQLSETTESQARLIEAIARFESQHSELDHPEGAFGATLSQIIDAYKHHKGFELMGEFTLAKLEGDKIVFLLIHRHGNAVGTKEKHAAVPISGKYAQPMQRALKGLSGAMVGLDYRGEKVLAAYKPVDWLDEKIGIVAKMDLAEIRAPFVNAGLTTGALAIVVILFGSLVFIRVSNPLIRRLEESEKKYRTQVETSNDAILVADADTGIIIEANSRAKDLFGSPVVGRNQKELHPPGKADYYGQLFKERGERGIGGITGAEIIHADGRIIPVDITASTFELSGRKFIQGNFRDITERRRAEEHIRRNAKELAQVNKELEEFNYIASHDLQEPLRTLDSYCALLKKDIGENLNDIAKMDMEFITDAASRMRTLVQDMLELSRAGHSELKIGRVDLNSIMDNVFESLATLIEKTAGNVVWAHLPTVNGDASQLIRLLQNLVDNGLKFHRDEPPLVKVFAGRKGDAWEITVADNGIGIEPKYLDQIFVPFKRLHGRERYKGSGIGLAICRKIIERHDGEVFAESEPGKGSRFRFTLKLGTNQQEIGG